MKNTFGITIFSALIISMFLSCKKPTEKKLNGTWTLENCYKNGNKDEPISFCNTELKFTENKYSITQNSNCIYNEIGTYSISDKFIIFIRTSDSYTSKIKSYCTKNKLTLVKIGREYETHEIYKK
jgi:hypothetical protein